MFGSLAESPSRLGVNFRPVLRPSQESQAVPEERLPTLFFSFMGVCACVHAYVHKWTRQ